MSRPAISVVLARKEGEDSSSLSLSMAMASVQNQTFKDYEIVIAEPRELLAVARNIALEKCTGEYVAFLNSDQTWTADKMAKQVALLARYPKLNWCYCAGDPSLPSANILRPLLLRNFIPSGSVMVRRSLIVDADGFNESEAYRSSEEWELWLRLAAIQPVALLPEALVQSPHERRETSQLQLSGKRVVEAAVARHPDLLLDLRSDALAEVCISAGNVYLMAEMREEARLAFAEALTHSPLRSDAYLCWISSFLPSEAQQQIRDLHNLSRHLRGAEKQQEQPISNR